ncbi:MAG: type II 3-dehydroquinate dehydratase [Deltaproteobacteria bacterium]|nr:type II 3-dehydroquinate dehydratase [Deltaproteobacteria bacterium]
MTRNVIPLHIEVINGPNMNLLGEREPELYGTMTLTALEAYLRALGNELDATVDCFQSNHEGALIDRLHQTRRTADGYIFNPAGYTHSSVALRDAVLAVAKPVVEVHLSNPDAREPFRRQSFLADVALGRVNGFGAVGYGLALRGLVHHLRGHAAGR